MIPPPKTLLRLRHADEMLGGDGPMVGLTALSRVVGPSSDPGSSLSALRVESFSAKSCRTDRP